jgi:hypothetical protein
MVAPSDLELEFEDIIINSQTYGRLLAQAQAKPGIDSLEELGDLIDFTDDDTVREEEPSGFGLPGALRALEGLSLHEPQKEKEPKESNDEPAIEEAGKFGPSKAILPRPLSRRTLLFYSTMRRGL